MLRHITFTVFITTSMNTLATGMVPETSVLLVDEKRGEAREGANKQVISSQVDSLIKISRIWANFFPANTSNQPI
ncbi:hypothetical protein VEGS18_A04990 [Escherichia coli]|nr:hypothetical protein VEGS18_A04990 [Escherichia coli]